MYTLRKLRCVCKEWQSLIDSSAFASLHFNLCNINRQNAPLFLIEGGYHEIGCFVRRSDTFRKAYEIVLPRNWGHLRPVGYVNGVILCSKYDDDGRVLGFVMWNPRTRKSIQIPPPSGSLHIRGIREVLVDPASGLANDYKLVVIPFDHPSWKRYHFPLNVPSSVLIEVYSLSTSSWRSSSINTKSVQQLMSTHHKAAVPMNGAVHWIGYNPPNGHCIVAFDVQNDVFHYFSLPPAKDVQFGVLSILHESLVLLKLEHSETGWCLIWVMENYGMAESWVNRFKINMGHGSFLYLKRNGKFFFTMGKQGVKVCDMDSGRVQDLAKTYSDHILLMDNFVETLGLPPEGNKELKKALF